MASQTIYDAALERLGAIRQAWFDEDQPLICEGVRRGGRLSIRCRSCWRATELEVVAIGQQIRKGHLGPVPKTVVSQRIGNAPSVVSIRRMKA